MCADLFLIMSACELCMLNCSWLLQHANYVCWTVPDYSSIRIIVYWTVPDYVSMRIKCAEPFLFVSACECVLNCSWLCQHANYVYWTLPGYVSMRIMCAELFLIVLAWNYLYAEGVPDCFSMQIMCGELFLIVSACELSVLNCSCLFQNVNYVCWTVPDYVSMRIMCAKLFLIVADCELCVMNCSWLFNHSN
jgi:hypothetical protein